MSTNHNDGVLTMTNSSRTNELGQPIGPSMGDWQAPPAVTLTTLYGTDVTLRPVDPARDAEPLQAAFEGDLAGWTYLPYGPFDSVEAHREWLALFACGADPLFFTIERHGRVVGIASYLRTKPADGSIEIGHVHLGHALQRTRGATEALTLMIRHAFELGYRRVEWKCDALNAPSRRAAQRLGLSFDGIFFRMTMYTIPAGTPRSSTTGRRCATATTPGSRRTTSMRTGNRSARCRTGPRRCCARAMDCNLHRRKTNEP